MPGYILIGCLVLLIILLSIKKKPVIIHNVYTDLDDDEEDKKTIIMEKEKLSACEPSEPVIQKELVIHNVGETFMNWAEKNWALETLITAGLNSNAGGESCPYKLIRDIFVRKINELTEKKKTLKLYHFNPNSWGEEYYTMAENKIKAHEALIKYFQNIATNDPDEYTKNMYVNYMKMWINVNPLDATTFPSPFTLDEFETEYIIESEIA